MFRLFHLLPLFAIVFPYSGAAHATNLGLGVRLGTAELRSPGGDKDESYFLQGYEFRGGLKMSPDVYGEIKAVTLEGKEGESRAQISGLSFGVKWNGEFGFVIFRPGIHAGLVNGLVIDDSPKPGAQPGWGQATTAVAEPEFDIAFKLSPEAEFYLSGSWRVHLVGPEWTTSFDGPSAAVGFSFSVGSGISSSNRDGRDPLTFESNKKEDSKRRKKKIRRNDADPYAPDVDAIEPTDIPENPEEDPYGSDLPAPNVGQPPADGGVLGGEDDPLLDDDMSLDEEQLDDPTTGSLDGT